MATLALSFGGKAMNLIMGLLAGHDRRMRIAKEENAALNQAMAAWDEDFKTIFSAANSGLITEQEAIVAVTDVNLWFWQFIGPFQQGPTKGGPGCSNIKCDKNCTAGCCVGCDGFNAACKQAIAIFRAGGGHLVIPPGGGNKYGYTGFNRIDQTYKRPKHVSPSEVTINRRTGRVTVGAPPSQADIVIAKGAINPQAQPDSGGVEITTQQAASEQPMAFPGFAGLSLGGTSLITIAVLVIVVALVWRGVTK